MTVPPCRIVVIDANVLADKDKVLLEGRRFRMPFASFGEVYEERAGSSAAGTRAIGDVTAPDRWARDQPISLSRPSVVTAGQRKRGHHVPMTQRVAWRERHQLSRRLSDRGAIRSVADFLRAAGITEG